MYTEMTVSPVSDNLHAVSAAKRQYYEARSSVEAVTVFRTHH